HGAGDRRCGLRRRAERQGQRRVTRAPDYRPGRRLDLSHDRARLTGRHVLRIDQDVTMAPKPGIKVRRLVVGLGGQIVLNALALAVREGEILGVVGGSGAGKSVLLRTIIGLLPKRQGSIEVLGVDLDKASEAERRALERRWGILFQQGALFSSLSIR